MIHKLLANKRVVLASKSPRRREIFKQLGLKVLYKTADIDETIDTGNPREFVTRMALNKCKEIFKKVDADCVVVAADTVVYANGRILGKPENSYHAAEYLTELSGNTHYVYTGLCVCYKHKCLKGYTKTAVTFKELTAEEISDYLETAEPDDKAGAYGIQGYGSQFITKVSGCYFNVMGFPVAKFYEILQELTVNENEKR
jgi:septum formation protein